MQSNRTKPSRAAGVGTTLSLLLLGALLTLAALYFSLTQLRPSIEADLTARVAESLDAAGIKGATVSVEGQDVTLQGAVSSATASARAEQTASDVYGVARVFNQLGTDGTGSESALTATEAALGNTQATEAEADADADAQDTEVETAMAAENVEKPVIIDNEQALSPSTLDIAVNDGAVTVQGIVPDNDTIDRIAAALAGKYGFANIEEDMSTFVGSATPQWLDGAIALIEQIDDIENPTLKITQNSARITGVVSSETLGNQKDALAQRLLGKYLDVSTDLSLKEKSSKLPAPEAKPRTLSKRPASLKIRSLNGQIQLTGTVSSEREAETIRTRLGELFRDNVSDRLTLDDSVERADWLNEALDSADTVKSVDNFSVSINSGQLLLSGDVDDRLFGRTMASAVAEIAGKKLNVVNSFAPKNTRPLALSSEDLQAQELMKKLDALNTKAIVFNSGRTSLTPAAKQVLNRVARLLKGYSNQIIEIAGHTDSSGEALANLELSRKRAIAVRQYLIEQKIPSSRLRPIGYGETKPVADNKTKEGQAANRRIEFNLESR